MASGRELCYLLLAGILMCYLMAIPILAKPSVFTCAVLRVGLGFALCLCYSSLLTKTNRISRIFNRGAKAGIKRPSYTSPKSQIVICCGNFSIFSLFFKSKAISIVSLGASDKARVQSLTEPFDPRGAVPRSASHTQRAKATCGSIAALCSTVGGRLY